MEAIKLNDLRIGNWINGSYEVQEISYRGVTIDSTQEDRHLTLVPFEQIKPIPLTEEILVKAGFEYSESKDWLKIETRIIKFTTDKSVEFSIVYAEVEDYNFAFVRTVHQLQNLYYSLTGQELNIQL